MGKYSKPPKATVCTQNLALSTLRINPHLHPQIHQPQYQYQYPNPSPQHPSSSSLQPHSPPISPPPLPLPVLDTLPILLTHPCVLLPPIPLLFLTTLPRPSLRATTFPFRSSRFPPFLADEDEDDRALDPSRPLRVRRRFLLGYQSVDFGGSVERL